MKRFPILAACGTPDVGILSSTDILAVDQACVDIVYAMTAADAAKDLKPFVK